MDYTLVDNREQVDSLLENAIHVPIYSFILENGVQALRKVIPDDKLVFLYCTAGVCAEAAKKNLIDLGYSNVVNLGSKGQAYDTIKAFNKSETKEQFLKDLLELKYE